MVLQAWVRSVVRGRRAAKGLVIAGGIAAVLGSLGVLAPMCGVGALSAASPAQTDGADHARDSDSLAALVRAGLPRGVWLPAALRPAVARMLERSPTFRAQCARLIALGSVHIGVTQDSAALRTKHCGAIAVIRRYASGIVVVAITLPQHGSPYDAFAHEVEHVIEYLEGVQLVSLAASGARRTEVWRGESGIETRRALEAGRRVARETGSADLLTSRTAQ